MWGFCFFLRVLVAGFFGFFGAICVSVCGGVCMGCFDVCFGGCFGSVFGGIFGDICGMFVGILVGIFVGIVEKVAHPRGARSAGGHLQTGPGLEGFWLSAWCFHTMLQNRSYMTPEC